MMSLPVATRAAHGSRGEMAQGRFARAGELIGNSFEIWLVEQWESLLGIVPIRIAQMAYQTMTDSEWIRHAEAIEIECWGRDAQWWEWQ